jgi:D-alanine-D-alanine ligase
VDEIYKGYRGWNLLVDGLFVEQFITGPEFTTFITGSADDHDNCIVYEPVERVFHQSLPDTEKFLSFDRLWEIYDDETPMPENENFYEYRQANAQLIPELKQLSLDAYKSCGGKGYARLDIRMDTASGKLYMLEVNAQCGLSEDENYTSIGAILKASKISYTAIIGEILKDALRRSMIKPKTVAIKRARPSKTKKPVVVK